ncbi:MAG: TonB-dependent receptor plug domain-containing protein [Longimicrobiales bacterium]
MNRSLRQLRIVTVALAGAVGAACAGEVPASAPPSPRPDDGPDSGRIVTAERIAASGARTAWEALRLLGNVRLDMDNRGEPTRISARGRSSVMADAPPKIVLNGLETESLFVLQQIPADAVVEIRFLTGPDATTYYGTNSGHGVVVITTKGR